MNDKQTIIFYSAPHGGPDVFLIWPTLPHDEYPSKPVYVRSELVDLDAEAARAYATPRAGEILIGVKEVAV